MSASVSASHENRFSAKRGTSQRHVETDNFNNREEGVAACPLDSTQAGLVQVFQRRVAPPQLFSFSEKPHLGSSAPDVQTSRTLSSTGHPRKFQGAREESVENPSAQVWADLRVEMYARPASWRGRVGEGKPKWIYLRGESAADARPYDG